jgi:hypothetical protein
MDFVRRCLHEAAHIKDNIVRQRLLRPLPGCILSGGRFRCAIFQGWLFGRDFAVGDFIAGG